MLKMYKFSFINNKVVYRVCNVEEKLIDTTGCRVYKFKDDSYKHGMFESSLNSICKGAMYSYYTLDSNFTEENYLQVLKKHFETCMHRDAIAIDKAKELFSLHQDNLLSVMNILCKNKEEN